MSALFCVLLREAEVKKNHVFEQAIRETRVWVRNSQEDSHWAWRLLNVVLKHGSVDLLDIALLPQFGIDLTLSTNTESFAVFVDFLRERRYFKKLLDNGLNINCIFRGGTTILHEACSRRKQFTIDELLKRHVNIDVRDNRGRSAIEIAIARSFWYGVIMLLAAGIDITYQTSAGHNLLACAISQNILPLTIDSHLAVRICAALASQGIPGAIPEHFHCTEAYIECEKEIIHELRLGMCKNRAVPMLIALQDIELAAPILIAIVDFFWSGARRLPYHSKWNMVCLIKHFHKR